MPARRRQRSGGLVGVIWVGLLAGLLAAGCTSPSPARQQPGADLRAAAAPLIAVPAGPGGVDVRAENAHAGYPGWRITSPGQPHEIEGYTDHASARTRNQAAVVETNSRTTVPARALAWSV